MADVGIDRRGVAEEVGLPLAAVAAHEAVEILEAHAGGPLIEGPNLAGLEGRRVVVLAEPQGGVAVVAEDAADGGLVFGNDAVVAGKTGGLLGDHAEARRVMVAPVISAARVGEQRAQEWKRVSRRPVLASRSNVGVGMTPPKVLWAPKPTSSSMIKSTLGPGRHDPRRPPRLGLRGVVPDHAAEFRPRRGELLPADRGGGAGRARHSRDLLGHARHRGRGDRNRRSTQADSFRTFHGLCLRVCLGGWFGLPPGRAEGEQGFHDVGQCAGRGPLQVEIEENACWKRYGDPAGNFRHHPVARQASAAISSWLPPSASPWKGLPFVPVSTALRAEKPLSTIDSS